MKLTIPLKKAREYNAKEIEKLTTALEKRGAHLAQNPGDFVAREGLIAKLGEFFTHEQLGAMLVDELVVSGNFDPAMIYAIIQEEGFDINYKKTKIALDEQK